MKRIMFTILALGLLLVSCGNKEEKGAVEYLKTELGNPSSFKLVSVEVQNENDTIIYDTLFHITAVDGVRPIEYLDFYESVNSITYDSVKVYENSFYASSSYIIKYEMENADGIKEQKEETVYLVNGSYSTDCEAVIKHVKEYVGKQALAGEMTFEEPLAKAEGLNEDRWFHVTHFPKLFTCCENAYLGIPQDIDSSGEDEPIPFSEEEIEEDVDEDYIYPVAEESPEYPGGEQALKEYISKNMQYPEIAKDMGIRGKVICKFTVRKDGSIADVTVVKSADPDLDREAIRLVSKMPKWKPGKVGGKVVNCKYSMPVVFKL